jgi:RNA polymerase sigma factor (sigma-70 family)
MGDVSMGAVEASLRKMRPSLLAMARRYSACEADAEDAVAEAIWRALERIESGRFEDRFGEAGLRTWVGKIVLRVCLEMRRKGRAQGSAIDQNYECEEQCDHGCVDVAKIVEERYAEERILARLGEAMRHGGLSEVQRAVMAAKVEGESPEATAARLGISAVMYRQSLARARNKIKGAWSADERDEEIK